MSTEQSASGAGSPGTAPGLLDSLHIPIGVTYNGSKRDSRRQWVAQAIEH